MALTRIARYLILFLLLPTALTLQTCGTVTLRSNKPHKLHKDELCHPLPEPAKAFLVHPGCGCLFYAERPQLRDAFSFRKRRACEGDPSAMVFGPMSRTVKEVWWYACGLDEV
ncbi:hypothetical protein BU26DRAFT_498740 [Trematosphaeria pertusa]|uniref:Secreted protein n=1 Tax=Trematosphaeria pertusa TaxID=390896 RepID=A0A6A6J3F0_9PLEO|nr:uncharacterized protein BU26DRAFT_498740 [Trematosphaeria pertusa]KAF2256003.1 hypothetical protein BU26DRAFT_498740 [Trematosphaeria pertusa]